MERANGHAAAQRQWRGKADKQIQAKNHLQIFTKVHFFFPLGQPLIVSPSKIRMPIKLAMGARSLPTTLNNTVPLHRHTSLYS